MAREVRQSITWVPLRSVTEPRTYYSERQGRSPITEGFDFETLRRVATSLISELQEQGYVTEAFGFYCSDQGGNVPGTAGSDVEAWFLRKIGRNNVWPWRRHWDDWDADTLFDVLEVLYDVVSKPMKQEWHAWDNCGWHFSQFRQLEGRTDYRAKLNPVLARFEVPLELTTAGEIRQLGHEGLRELLNASVPEGTDEGIEERVSDAVRLFRQRHASVGDRRRAVRELADVLEALRPEVKEQLLNDDERDLFTLANSFAIRHNNSKQKSGYDGAVWLAWMFHVNLAAVHVVLRLRARGS